MWVETAAGRLYAEEAGDLDLTIVVPFFNPGDLLARSLSSLVEVLRGTGVSFEVIAVSDGSTDGSADAVAAIAPDVLRCVALPRNHGKGEALRVGLAMGRGRYLGFLDADGDIAATLMPSFLAVIDHFDPDIVLGSKRHPMSQVNYPRIRRLYSWGYQQVVRALFRLNVRETQTGLKIVRRDVLASVLPRMVEKRFAFDLELLVVARRLGFHRFFEAPVRIDHQFTSTVSTYAVWRILLDTLAIFYRLHFLHFYDRTERSAPTAG